MLGLLIGIEFAVNPDNRFLSVWSLEYEQIMKEIERIVFKVCGYSAPD